jgi:hypothetical protein
MDIHPTWAGNLRTCRARYLFPMSGWPRPSAVGEALSAVRYVCGLKGVDQLAEQPGEYLLLVRGQGREQGTFAVLHFAAVLLERACPAAVSWTCTLRRSA